MSALRKLRELLASLPGRIWELRHRPAGWIVPRLLASLAVLLGVIGLGTAVAWWLAVVALVIAILTAFRWFDEIAGRIVGAAIVATIALVGFNVATFFVTRPEGKALDWIAAAVMFGVVAFGFTRSPRWRPTMLMSFGVLGLGFLVDVFPKRPGIAFGLLVAVLLFSLVVYWRLSGAAWGRRRTAMAALAVAAFVILVPPILLAPSEPKRGKVATNQHVASKLDVLIVTDGRHHAAPDNPLRDAARGFDVSYSVGYAVGRRVHWTLPGTPNADAALVAAAMGAKAPVRGAAPARRDGADPVLVLLVDGTDPVTEDPAKLPERRGGGAAEVDRWRRVALAVNADANPPVPTFPLLQTSDKKRLAQWDRFLTPGRAVSLQELGSQTVADAGVQLGVGAPTSRQDFNLAVEHRPLLLFDQSEPVPRPLSVASLFSQRRVKLCHDRRLAGTDCDEPVTDARELSNDGTHLQIAAPSSKSLRATALAEKQKAKDAAAASETGLSAVGAPPPATPLAAPITSDSGEVLGRDSTIYVHPVSSGDLLYLDYWWYLSDNPAEGLGLGAFCGAGFVIPGVTCHNHQSDWEGITVVVDRSRQKPVVTNVQYAQHEKVVRYDWQELVRRWDRKTGLPSNELKVEPSLAHIAAATGRPLAFVAHGTHSTYPTPCNACRQVATSIGEDEHDGKLAWIGNYTMRCGNQDCLQVLPTREGGSRAALWNAFAGPWGELRCVFKYYCNSGKAPAAPGTQHRYNRPTHYDGVVDENWKFKAESGG